MVGEPFRAWYVATTALDFERSGIERNLIARTDWSRIRDAVRLAPYVRVDSDRRHRMAGLFVEIEVGHWIARRIAWLQGRGRLSAALTLLRVGRLASAQPAAERNPVSTGRSWP